MIKLNNYDIIVTWKQKKQLDFRFFFSGKTQEI